MKFSNLVLFLCITLVSTGACGQDPAQTENESREKEEIPVEHFPEATDITPNFVTSNPDLKKELENELQRIVAKRESTKRPDEVRSMIADLYALFDVLTVSTRAYDKAEAFKTEIETERQRFRNSDKKVDNEAGRIMNGLTGVYYMYAILAKMRFVGREEQQKQINGIHKAISKVFLSDGQAAHAAAVIAKSVYMLCTMVMRDIDADGLFLESFEGIEETFKEGEKVSTNDEDRYINGMFRAFEVSQLWALLLNPAERDIISSLNREVAAKGAQAKTVGEQMSIATEYMYRISLHIATQTVSVTL